MILSVASQSAVFFMSVLLGGFAGFLYDCFRILRKMIKHPDFLTQLEDLVFWMFVSGVVFYFVLNRNSGEVRFYIILGAFLGMGLYFITLSIFIMAVASAVVDFLHKSFSALFSILSFPVRLLARLFMIPLRRAGIGIKKARKPVKKLLQKPARYAKIKARGLARDIRIVIKKV